MDTITKQRARVKRPKGRLSQAVQIRMQHQIRTTAPKASAFGPIVQAPLSAWNQSTDALEQLQAQVDVHVQALKQLRTSVHMAKAAFHADQSQFISAVELVSNGDPQTIRDLGYEALVGKGATVATAVEPPVTLTAKPGVDPGAVHLHWTTAPRAKAYALQISTDPSNESAWSSLEGETGVTRKLGGLKSGQRYGFRVASLSAAGRSRYGELASTTARLARRAAEQQQRGRTAEDVRPRVFISSGAASR